MTPADTLVEHLQERLGAKAVLADPDILESHRYDHATFCPAGTARLLVRPTTTEQAIR